MAAAPSHNRIPSISTCRKLHRFLSQPVRQINFPFHAHFGHTAKAEAAETASFLKDSSSENTKGSRSGRVLHFSTWISSSASFRERRQGETVRSQRTLLRTFAGGCQLPSCTIEIEGGQETKWKFWSIQ